MGTLQDAVDAVAGQLTKAKAEILGKIADLEAQIERGEALDLSALRAAAQALDDVVPDQVPVEPEPTPEPEPRPEVDTEVEDSEPEDA